MKIIGPNPSPITTKTIPPIYSHFQETTRSINKIKEGIRWMKNAPSCCQIVCPGANESKANMHINNIARIQRILGIQ